MREIRLFDLYEGKNLPDGSRSLAFSLVFGSIERTLDTGEVERLRARVSSVLENKGWALRV